MSKNNMAVIKSKRYNKANKWMKTKDRSRNRQYYKTVKGTSHQ